ncbi:MAG: 3-isopropylmalate dehydratase large subunit [Desulfobacteraceae bacterium]|nr:3-isopropylmalate dehydratase large subunit [Desulfobacteraceae bacterium]
MGMTITEKILARAAGKDKVKAGEIVNVDVDWRMSNDATTHLSIDIFENKVKNKKIDDPKKTVFIIDHNVPSESVKTTHVQNKKRAFARKHGINLHDGQGVCHQILLEKYISPGQVIIAADSHTCSAGALGAFGTGVGSTDFVGAMVTGKTWLMVPRTLKFEVTGSFQKGVFARDLILKIVGDIKSDGATYMAMEFGGPGVRNLNVNDRIVLCNLTVEAGAKNGIIEPDETIEKYLQEQGRGSDNMVFFKSDPDCDYEKVFDYDISSLEPAVVSPHFVDNYDTVTNKEKENIIINQGFIGSCNNGRIEDLRVASDILKGKKIKPDLKLIMSPASQDVYIQALREGIIEIFLDSGAMVVNPNCSVCWGACQGVIGEGEVLISTGTRNFKGRAGSPDSFVYLGSAATVAASCLTGKITDPRNYV